MKSRKNLLWFTLNYRGYSGTYQINRNGEGPTKDLIKPEAKVPFPRLIQVLTEAFNDDFYVPGVKVIFDRHPKSHGAEYIPLEERKAIRALIHYQEDSAKQKADYENRLEKIIAMARGSK